MSNQKNLKEEIKENKGKFKSLSFAGKIGFIRDYYWLHISAVILAIILIISIVHTVRVNSYNTAINVIITNNTVADWVEENDVLEAYIINGFAAYTGLDNVNDRIFVNDYYLVADARDSELSAINSQTLTAMFAGCDIDIYIGDNKSINYFASDTDPFFTDLSSFLDAAAFEKAKDMLVYFTYKDGNNFPFAIDVTDTPFAKQAGFVSDQVIIAIPDNTTRPEMCAEFINYVLSVE